MKITNVLRAIAVAGALSFAMLGGAQAVTLNLGNGSEPGSLDPHKASGDWENRIIGELFEGLLAEDAHADAIPGQAESWTISDDGTVYTFKLRADAKWSEARR
jgi:oligopeptide transport system substrate-binding protein